MRVLIIDCYDEGPIGRASFETFESIIRRALATAPARAAVAIPNLMVRRPYELKELAVDYEFDRIDESARTSAKKFDSFDLIVVSGDSKSVPWDPKYLSVITILWCSLLVNKPLLCCGFGAIAAIYASATQGVRFNFLNRYKAGNVESISTFAHFAKASGPHPGVFYDSETGDLYSYSTQLRAWCPLLNIGVYCSPRSGQPLVGKLRARPKHFLSEDHMLPGMLRPETPDDHEEFVQVSPRYAGHFVLRSIPQQCFSCAVFPEYYLNNIDALPQNGFGIAAETRLGPLVLVNGYSLIFAGEVGKQRKHKSSRQIVRNFIFELVEVLGSSSNGCLGSRLEVFLFGPLGNGDDGYDPVSHKKIFAAPTVSLNIPSALPDGPKMIHDAASKYIAEFNALVTVKEAAKAAESLSARRGTPNEPSSAFVPELSGPSRSPTFSPRPASPRITMVREPEKNRKKRLEAFLRVAGQKRLIKMQANLTLQDIDTDAESANNDDTSYLESYALHGVQALQLTSKSKSKKRPGSGKSDDCSTAASDKSSGRGSSRMIRVAVTETEERRSNASGSVSDYQPATRPGSRHSRVVSPGGDAENGKTPSATEAMPCSETGRVHEVVPMTFPRHRPRSASKEAPEVQVSSNADQPYNSMRRFEELAKKIEEDERREYKGTFATVYLSDYEKQLLEHKARKEKFIAGDFIRFIGKTSGLKPAEPALVTHLGPYPDRPPPMIMAPAKDWVAIRREEKHKHIGKHWV